MNQFPFQGLGVAIPTPFNRDFTIDYRSLEKIIDYVSPHADYLVILGTTSESPTLSEKEKQDICDFIASKNNYKLPLVIGIGANDTYKVISRISKMNLNGFSAILSVVPYYNKPTQEGIFQHFKKISETSSLPIILYNVPGRTSVNMEASTTLRLAKESKNIIAIKEASGDISQIKKIIENKSDGFEVIAGDDFITFEAIKSGAIGTISVAANAIPLEIKKIIKESFNQNLNKAENIDQKLKSFYKYIFKEGNPAGIKCALNILDIIKDDNLRLPLVKVSNELRKEIKTFLDNYK